MIQEMSDKMTNFKVPVEDVILSGITTNPQYCHKEFIIYISRQPDCKGIWVNTYYKLEDGVYNCCTYYSRRICNSIEEFTMQTIGYIESLAYGAWMDGAR